nr:hybrid signal transduction histidine kinase M [Tanacetum cinerariifolium]
MDLEIHNYNAWSSFSLIYLGSLGHKAHVESETVKQVVTTSGNAKNLWDHLKDLFHDYKYARAFNLDNELRTIKMGMMTVNEYCTKIRSMADRIKNHRGDVSDKNLVLYTVNGLDSRFDTLVEIIRHCETFPSFATTRNMLLLKESSFNESTDASTTFESSSLSPTILMASKSSDNKGPTHGVKQAHADLATAYFTPVYYTSTGPGPMAHTVQPPQQQSTLGRSLSSDQAINFLAAFASTSSTTWHQCLGHPRDEVLRSLSSRHFTSCKKEKSTHICHACQLGKHVKLLFYSSHSIVHHCFDIIHSDFQQLGVDFDETFSPVVKPATIRTVKNAFLNSDLSKNIYMHQPPRFVDSRGLYVMPPRLVLLTAVMILLCLSTHKQIIDYLNKEFDMTDLRALNYHLGISVVRHSMGIFLSQKKYALELLACAHMVNCNLSRTPVDYEAKLGPDKVSVQDPTLYRNSGVGLHLYASATTPLVGYTDADWAGCPSTRMSTSRYCVFIGDNLLSWSAKRQHIVSRSSVKSEY